MASSRFSLSTNSTAKQLFTVLVEKSVFTHIGADWKPSDTAVILCSCPAQDTPPELATGSPLLVDQSKLSQLKILRGLWHYCIVLYSLLL